MPTDEDSRRLREVARYHRCVREVLTASWKKGKAAKFYRLRGKRWTEVADLDAVFR
jgi:hypothetical protein